MKKNSEEKKEAGDKEEDALSQEKIVEIPPSLEEKKIILSSAEWEEMKKKASRAEEYYEKLLRLGAEFENVRKRMDKEKEEIIRFANQELLLEILPVVDDFDRLLEGLAKNQINGEIFAGIKMIQKRIHEVLDEYGLVRMKVVGDKFDPAKHEALMTVETDEQAEGTIVEEIRSGYLLNNKILRPAVVKVAKKKTTSENQ